jgi:hypothetical protein
VITRNNATRRALIVVTSVLPLVTIYFLVI